MTIKSYIHKLPNSHAFRISEDEWESKRYGFLKGSDEGEINREKALYLEEEAQKLDYEESLSIGELFLSRLYGGSIDTPYGRREWQGKTPEDVQNFLDEVKAAIDG